MPPRKPRPADEKPDPLDGLPQIERFKAVARELGCDDDEATFRAKLGVIARHTPPAEPKKSAPRKR
jgi:hypothetical protein